MRSSGSTVLDPSRLDFIDATGLGFILDCDTEAREDGFSIAFIRGPRAVHRVFELSQTSAQLPFIDP